MRSGREASRILSKAGSPSWRQGLARSSPRCEGPRNTVCGCACEGRSCWPHARARISVRKGSHASTSGQRCSWPRPGACCSRRRCFPFTWSPRALAARRRLVYQRRGASRQSTCEPPRPEHLGPGDGSDRSETITAAWSGGLAHGDPSPGVRTEAFVATHRVNLGAGASGAPRLETTAPGTGRPAQEQAPWTGTWHRPRRSADQGRQSQCQAIAGLRARRRRHAGAKPGGHRPGPPPAQDDRRVGTAPALVLRPARRSRQVRPRRPSDPGSAR